jgi:hypothetical protein
MPQSLPEYELQLRPGPSGPEVWDSIRKKWLVFTPEEQVRQCLIQFLADVCGVPRTLMSLERGLHYDRRRKRYDLLIYDRNGKPFILCECKEPRVPIDDAVVQQISLYNAKIGARMLVLTNGPVLIAFGRNANSAELMQDGSWKTVAFPDPNLAGGAAWFEAALGMF